MILPSVMLFRTNRKRTLYHKETFIGQSKVFEKQIGKRERSGNAPELLDLVFFSIFFRTIASYFHYSFLFQTRQASHQDVCPPPVPPATSGGSVVNSLP